ncbi:TetR/AcrR family transcriptional regulator [Aeromicrobium duanguangcaii]|uniref:TetR/AcrR family transcriptional regulator n=1 Tax=Aeromicrobium duanguangcaii TaxID=2968086 RepID=A0ABY5KE19_9ACTN|nr:TetR/AcrR family transcriptional regulator [Aeromicrobium duanguangcaii]MCD9154915.1 TetR/AcrR family transcriptional regulator; helix-turn-helix transcriptional regulator [Aeromicrobium duanguangcaii]UUI67676.1 TetR/AcrR family transcriptional regulator [Aeromicrobium duanguangcaii]
MRADAARRREAIVHAARSLVAARGSDVALDAVAEAAGVGIGTLYRNFDSRAALLDEVALSILSDVRTATRETADRLGETSQEAWDEFVHRLVGLELGALTAALADHAGEALSPEVQAAQDEALAGVGRLLEAVQGAGLVRRDLTALELVTTVGMITRPVPESVRRAAPDLRTRLVSILSRGLRPEDS